MQDVFVDSDEISAIFQLREKCREKKSVLILFIMLEGTKWTSSALWCIYCKWEERDTLKWWKDWNMNNAPKENMNVIVIVMSTQVLMVLWNLLSSNCIYCMIFFLSTLINSTELKFFIVIYRWITFAQLSGKNYKTTINRVSWL